MISFLISALVSTNTTLTQANVVWTTVGRSAHCRLGLQIELFGMRYTSRVGTPLLMRGKQKPTEEKVKVIINKHFLNINQ